MGVQLLSFEDNQSYATRENAEKKLRKLLDGPNEHWRCIIIQTERGRFVPVVLPRNEQQHMVFPLASLGLTVLG